MTLLELITTRNFLKVIDYLIMIFHVFFEIAHAEILKLNMDVGRQPAW